MTALTMEDLRAIAADVVANQKPDLWLYYKASYSFDGPLTPKERPRPGKSGKMFTPPQTRKFEKTVKDWAVSCGMDKVAFPVKVYLCIYDTTLNALTTRLGKLALTYDTRGDLDNYAKAILDALNKVAYVDDKQIVDLHVMRVYSDTPGFCIDIDRAGLSKSELDTVIKIATKLRLET